MGLPTAIVEALFIGIEKDATKHKKQNEYIIPEWCKMHPHAHNDGMDGCWGISDGSVARQGESYCKECEYYKKGK